MFISRIFTKNEELMYNSSWIRQGGNSQMLQVIILISNRVKDSRVESENEKNYLSRNKYKDIVGPGLFI